MLSGERAPTPWELRRDEPVVDCGVFAIHRHWCYHPLRATEAPFHIIALRDWAVAFALTPERELVLVRQYRFGSQALSWEPPAGCIEAGEDPVAAAMRELREETGYGGGRSTLLGRAHPNPALQGNWCYFVLIEDAVCLGAPAWDPHEELEVATVPLEEAEQRAATEGITHAMAHAGLFFLSRYLRRGGSN